MGTGGDTSDDDMSPRSSVCSTTILGFVDLGRRLLVVLGVERGFISGGWRLFVETDSYAIALSFLRLLSFTVGLVRIERSNSMGLTLEARSPPFLTSLCLDLETLFRKPFLEAGVKGSQDAGSNRPGFLTYVQVMIYNHRVKH